MTFNNGSGTEISFSEIQAFYGGSNPISLSEYNRGGSLVPSTRTDTTTQTSINSGSVSGTASFDANQSVFDYNSVNNTNFNATQVTGNITFGSSATVDFVGDTFFSGGGSGDVSPNTIARLGSHTFTSGTNKISVGKGSSYSLTSANISFGSTIRVEGFATDSNSDKDNGSVEIFSINGTAYSGSWQNGGAGTAAVITGSAGDIITASSSPYQNSVTVFPQNAQRQGRSDLVSYPAGTYAFTGRVVGGNDFAPDFRFELRYSGGGTVRYTGFNGSVSYGDTAVTVNTNTNVPTTVGAGNSLNLNTFNSVTSASP